MSPVQPDGLRVLEGLAASGLRSFRYALEVEGLARVDANDMDADAVANIRLNYPWNPAAAAKVVATQNDARILMMQHEKVRKPGKLTLCRELLKGVQHGTPGNGQHAF